MNWDPFKCCLCYLCLCGTMLAPLTLMQEVVSSNTTFCKLSFINSVEFYRISLGKTRMTHVKCKIHHILIISLMKCGVRQFEYMKNQEVKDFTFGGSRLFCEFSLLSHLFVFAHIYI